MDREIGLKMLKVEESAASDQGYQFLLEEYRLVSGRFLQALETMSHEQRDAVEDYCGLVAEMYRKMLELACKL